MDDKFIERVKSMSEEMLDEQQRPETAYRPGGGGMNRAPSAVFGVRRPYSGAVGSGDRGKSWAVEQDEPVIATLASYKPNTPLFTFNNPRTGTANPEKRGPSARPSRAGLASSMKTRIISRIDETESDYIPDLDEVQEQDLTMTMASAPAYELQKMATLTELNAELSQTKALGIVEGVNLRRLCKFLVPEKELIEYDETWTWDRLYNETISTPEFSHMIRLFQKDTESEGDIIP